jgi:drug/metabolite transporter (DMT)-like permease
LETILRTGIIFTRSHFTPYVVLLFGVTVAATSSILVRFAQMEGVPSVSIATWRLIFAAVILTPLAWSRRTRELRSLQPHDIRLGVLAGVFLAIHLATWIYSLEFTSVASSAALVTTNPLWIALAVTFLYRERLSRNTITGLAAALTGSVLVAFSDGGVLTLVAGQWHFNPQALLSPGEKVDTALWGDALALLGAVMASAYLLVGRTLRTHLSTLSYVWLVYTAAMVALVGFSLLAGPPLLGYTWPAYLWIFLLAIGPQLIGHTTFNWSLAHLSTTFVALAILGEPIGSAIFAYFIFGETFAPLQLFGFVLLLAGIGLGALGEQGRKVGAQLGAND